jgi:predicted nucleic-acid-binding protein
MERDAREAQVKAVDTNVLLRYIVRDDQRQFDTAVMFLGARTAADPVFVSLIVAVELIWVLRRQYRYPREDIRTAIMALMEAAEVVFEDEEYLSALLASFPKGDIADHLIAHCATRAGCSSTVTFDKVAVSGIPSMELLS